MYRKYISYIKMSTKIFLSERLKLMSYFNKLQESQRVCRAVTAHVKILLHAMFREVAGQREILHEVNPDFTLRDMLNALAKKYGKEFNSIIDPKTGQVSLDTLVMVNGKSVRKPDVQLRDNDVVMITVPVGGG